MSSHLYQYDKISDKSKQFAIDNLNENPSQVNAHIESFRRWVKSMPHLNCPTDAEFLLRFLRVAKFDHKKAEKRLDNFCTGRGSIRGYPEFFQQIDDSIIDEYLDACITLPLGRNENDEMIFLMLWRFWNPERINFVQAIALLFMVGDVLASYEETQIHGIKVLFDFENFSRKAIEAACDPKSIKHAMRIVQDSFPIRLKGLIFFKELVLVKVFLNIFSFFMKEKLKKRVLRVNNNVNKIIAQNPGLEKILPTEYGGQGGSLKSCAEKWKVKFKNYFKSGNPLSSVSVDESRRPPETKKYFAEYSDYKGETLSTEIL